METNRERKDVTQQRKRGFRVWYDHVSGVPGGKSYGQIKEEEPDTPTRTLHHPMQEDQRRTREKIDNATQAGRAVVVPDWSG
ncbi:hypothetical protein DPEC_G00228060 [Dallia pectoralis]|uniref:Uncharacterized protein n=1 Tax=Dallia pectoralis TaxID=75939 RepID=A0ACC2G137_DALPE|nr:hypothetical protein DPEC_G00228060 [Dallia pectoralis]